jgi:uncharacterized protein (DUF58 family)
MNFDAAFLKRCESLHRAARRGWGRALLGRRANLRLAGGTEVTALGDYTTGDDFRYVDWHRCARHDELLSKRFQGSENQSVHVLLDGSASMRLGSPSKFDAARTLTAALAYLALANYDSVGVTLFADQVAADLPPLCGRQKIAAMLRFIGGLQAQERPTDLKRAAESLVRRGRARGLVVVVSDLLDPAGFAPAVDLLRRFHYQPYLLQVFDRFDSEPELLGKIRFEDAETGRTLSDSLDERDLANYRDVFREFCQSVRRYCSRYGIGLMQTRTDVGFETCLEKMVRTRR